MLSKLLGPFQVKEYLHHVSHAMDLSEDLSFLRTVQQTFFPIPLVDREPILDPDLFPPWRKLEVPALAGKKVGIVATGGSGAMICSLGVMRACEEAGLEIAGISACSGSAMFLAPVAAGHSAQEAVEFALSWRQDDYIEPRWRSVLEIPLTLGRGFTGFLNTEKIELLLHRRLGGVLVKDLPIPFYANIWDIDHNRLHYMGTRTRPDMRLARLARAAMTLPLFTQPVEIDGNLCGDGGVINIFPVDPLVDHHPEIDFFIGINAFYPEDFDGENLTGWDRQTFSLLRVSPQPRHGQHLEAARMQLRRIRERCLLLHPVPYQEIKGVMFYEQFLNRSRWPEFAVRGYYTARRGLETLEDSRQ